MAWLNEQWRLLKEKALDLQIAEWSMHPHDRVLYERNLSRAGYNPDDVLPETTSRVSRCRGYSTPIEVFPVSNSDMWSRFVGQQERNHYAALFCRRICKRAPTIQGTSYCVRQVSTWQPRATFAILNASTCVSDVPPAAPSSSRCEPSRREPGSAGLPRRQCGIKWGTFLASISNPCTLPCQIWHLRW